VRILRRFLILSPLSVAVVSAQVAQGQTPGSVTDILTLLNRAAGQWLPIAESAAQTVFGYLAMIDCAIAIGFLLLEAADLVQWTAEFARRALVIGAWYTLLLFGPRWLQDVIDSYTQFGSQASGIQTLSAGTLAAQGITICIKMLGAGVLAGTTLSPVTAAVLIIGSVAVFAAYFRLCRAYVMAKAEAYITISAAAIQLGFGGSRFTSVYAERYVTGAFATGVKLMVFYLVVGLGSYFYPIWLQLGTNAALQGGGVRDVCILVFAILTWCSLADIDKWAASIFVGNPQFSGADFANSYRPMVSAGLYAATMAGGAAFRLAAPALSGVMGGAGFAGRAAGAATGSGGGFAGSSRAGTAVVLTSYGSGGGRTQPPPPPSPRRLPPASRALPAPK
jgi:type IV secretion system protein TrbL